MTSFKYSLVYNLAVVFILSFRYVWSFEVNYYPPENEDIECTLSPSEKGVCVYAYLCKDGRINTDGSELVDLRMLDECFDYMMKCCSKRSNCAENKGRCMPDGGCRNFNKYQNNTECNWSGMKCCPNEHVIEDLDEEGSTYIVPDENPDSTMQNCNNNEGVCVTPDQCKVNTDGRGLLNPKILSECPRNANLCCPKNMLKKVNEPKTDGCSYIGGRCTPGWQCTKQPLFDIRTSHCETPGYVCCLDDNRSTSFALGKPCNNRDGICIAKCSGTTFIDKKNECNGLKCCAHADSNFVSTKPNRFVGQKCLHGTGTCVETCSTSVATDRRNECGGLKCCIGASEVIGSTTNTNLPDDQDSFIACDNNEGVCVTPDQCTVNTDGRGLLTPKVVSECPRRANLCCPKDKLKKGNEPETDGCSYIGGRCTLGRQCKNQPLFDIRTSQCETPGYVCCLDDKTSTSSAIGKPCKNGDGICTAKCRGTTYVDKKNECDGSKCCAYAKPKPTGTTSLFIPPPPNEFIGQPCHNGTGKCFSKCDRPSIKESNHDCNGLECCEEEQTDRNPRPVRETYIRRGCGYRNEDGLIFSTTGRLYGESQYGEFPWVVAIFEQSTSVEKLKCSGTLIDPEVVLTTADCVRAFRANPRNLIIRAGEWDIGSKKEPLPFQDRTVRLIKSHPHFKPTTLINNVALLFVWDKFDIDFNVDTACIPPQSYVIDNGYVVATGWGTTPKERNSRQQILKSFELPYNQRSECQHSLRRATGNRNFVLHDSFICAGGETLIDTCQGDGGAPIIYEIPTDMESRYYVVGMVSWGVSCGRTGVSGAYTNVAMFKNWIDQEMRNQELPVDFYTYEQDEPEIDDN